MFRPILSVLLVTFTCLLAPARLAAQTFTEVNLTSTYDGVVTRSVIMEPANYDGTPRPLIITLHGMGGNAWTGLTGFDVSANSRGWLLASPDTHGENDPTGENSLAARAAQHDILDLIDYVELNYAVDANRIYITGGSMGGMTTTIMAAKYPERFAAAAEWFGPSDLAQGWNELWWGSYRANMRAEIGGSPTQFPWEYARRSPIYYARNLRYMPFVIGQGRFDIVVLPHHSRDLAAEIEFFRPTAFFGIYWNFGMHFLMPGDYDRTLDFLAYFTLQGDPPEILFQTDEDQSAWWMSVTGAVMDDWRVINAVPLPAINKLFLQTENAATVTIDIPRAGLNPHSTLSVVLSQTCDSSFVLTDLNPAHTYTVSRGGTPWSNFSWNPASATLSVDVLLAQAGPTPFVIQ